MSFCTFVATDDYKFYYFVRFQPKLLSEQNKQKKIKQEFDRIYLQQKRHFYNNITAAEILKKNTKYKILKSRANST